jgi:hypothetical protein
MQKKKPELAVVSVKIEGSLKEEFETWLWVHRTSKTDAIREMILALIRPETGGSQKDVKS